MTAALLTLAVAVVPFAAFRHWTRHTTKNALGTHPEEPDHGLPPTGPVGRHDSTRPAVVPAAPTP